jgi:hypothetical protein
VAVAAFGGDGIYNWKKQLLDGAASVFEGGGGAPDFTSVISAVRLRWMRLAAALAPRSRDDEPEPNRLDVSGRFSELTWTQHSDLIKEKSVGDVSGHRRAASNETSAGRVVLDPSRNFSTAVLKTDSFWVQTKLIKADVVPLNPRAGDAIPRHGAVTNG